MIRIRTMLCAASAAFGLTLGLNAFAAQLTIDIPACSTYTLVGNTLTCNTSSPGNPICSISGPSSGTVGTAVNVNGSCGTDAALAWTGCSTSSGSVCTLNPNQAGAITVSLNGSAGTTGASKTVTFSDPNAPPPPGIPATCTDDGSKTVNAGNITDFDGVSVGSSSFNKAQTAYYVLRVPALGANTQIQLAWLSIGGFSDQVVRQVYASKTSVCDTSTPLTTGQSFNGSVYGAVNDGQSGITGVAKQGNLKMHLQPGDTWYIMFKNLSSTGKNSCSTGPCPIFIKPAVLR